MKPYFEKNGVTLYHADCRDVLPLLAPGSVEAVVTDPPYGIAHKCNFGERGRSVLAACNNYEDVYDDDKPFDPSHLLALNLPTILWGGNHFASKLPDSSGWLVWDKDRPDDLDQSTCELAWTNYVKGVRRFKHLWNGMMKASERGLSYHPTQKPVALFAWIIETFAPFGGILDPYMGAGPCGVACAHKGRSYIGIEIVEEYCEIAARRIEAALGAVQKEMFT